jgi:hypothetical protein
MGVVYYIVWRWVEGGRDTALWKIENGGGGLYITRRQLERSGIRSGEVCEYNTKDT